MLMKSFCLLFYSWGLEHGRYAIYFGRYHSSAFCIYLTFTGALYLLLTLIFESFTNQRDLNLYLNLGFFEQKLADNLRTRISLVAKVFIFQIRSIASKYVKKKHRKRCFYEPSTEEILIFLSLFKEFSSLEFEAKGIQWELKIWSLNW